MFATTTTTAVVTTNFFIGTTHSFPTTTTCFNDDRVMRNTPRRRRTTSPASPGHVCFLFLFYFLFILLIIFFRYRALIFRQLSPVSKTTAISMTTEGDGGTKNMPKRHCTRLLGTWYSYNMLNLLIHHKVP